MSDKPAHPPLIPVESSWLHGYHYDPAERALTVQTKTGKTYVYEGVSGERAAALDGAESPGKYLNDQIIKHHTVRKL